MFFTSDIWCVLRELSNREGADKLMNHIFIHFLNFILYISVNLVFNQHKLVIYFHENIYPFFICKWCYIYFSILVTLK